MSGFGFCSDFLLFQTLSSSVASRNRVHHKDGGDMSDTALNLVAESEEKDLGRDTHACANFSKAMFLIHACFLLE